MAKEQLSCLLHKNNAIKIHVASLVSGVKSIVACRKATHRRNLFRLFASVKILNCDQTIESFANISMKVWSTSVWWLLLKSKRSCLVGWTLVRKYANFQIDTGHGLYACSISAKRLDLQDCINTLCSASYWKQDSLNTKMGQEGTINSRWKMQFLRRSKWPVSLGKGFGPKKRCN